MTPINNGIPINNIINHLHEGNSHAIFGNIIIAAAHTVANTLLDIDLNLDADISVIYTYTTVSNP